IDSKNAGLFRLATSSRRIKDPRRIWGRDYTVHGGLPTRRRADLRRRLRLRFWIYQDSAITTLKPVSLRWRQVNEWFFGGTTDNWLAALRIGLGLQLVLYCITSRADWLQMFTLHPGSFVTRDLTEALVTLGSALVPRVSWFISAGELTGLSEATVLWVVWSVLLAAGLCLVAGIFCRSAAIAAWSLHLSAIKSSALLSYAVDNFTSIGLFYLLLWSLPANLARRHHRHAWRDCCVDGSLSFRLYHGRS